MTSFFDTWQANKDRPAWVRNNRDAIMERVDVDDDIPESLAAVPEWLDRYKSTVTRQLNPDNQEEEPDEQDDGGDE